MTDELKEGDLVYTDRPNHHQITPGKRYRVLSRESGAGFTIELDSRHTAFCLYGTQCAYLKKGGRWIRVPAFEPPSPAHTARRKLWFAEETTP